MYFSESVAALMKDAFSYASARKMEYVLPETILYMALDNPIFALAFAACSGDRDLLEKDLQRFFEENCEEMEQEEIELSWGAKQLLALAGQSAMNSGADEADIRHLIHGMFQLENSHAVYFIEKQEITEAELLEAMAEAEEDAAFEAGDAFTECEVKGEAALERAEAASVYAPCLNDAVKDKNPLIGREEELERTIRILCRKDKNNPLHLGEPGVGKTAITYGLVRRILDGKVPEPLKDAKVFSLDLGGMLAGTQYRGDFEKRFKKVLAEIGSEKNPIIYIDEIHNLSGAGAVGEGSFDASNLLKPYLTESHIRFIGATTFEEYKKYFEKNKSLARRFQPVEIQEPSAEETVEILKGLKKNYEKYHGVKYGKGVLEYIAKMSAKLIHERFLPDKAIDLMDEAGAYRKLYPLEKKTQSVGKDVVNQVLTGICRVPVAAVDADQTAGLAVLETRMKQRVFGQDAAIAQVVNAVKFSKAGLLEENKPLASLLFVGPTGVGKTEIARSLAEEMGLKLIRFDMSEYGEKHAVAKLIGSPAGYVGYEEGGLLTETIRKNPQSVLLLDEIEKAHPDIYNVLLQVMDYATLTDNQGRKADFKNVILIMTSNAGAAQIGKAGIGFTSMMQDPSVIMETVNRTFQPEFRNRLNRIVVFNGMDDAMARQVAVKKLSELQTMLMAKKIQFEADDKAVQLLCKKGTSKTFGAREIDRVIRNEIKSLFVDEILFGKLKRGGKLKLTAEGETFTVVTGK